MPERTLSAMADPRVWAYLELRTDLTFVHQTATQRLDYVEKALAIGEGAARPYEGQQPLALAETLGVSVRYVDELGPQVRAAYAKGTLEVNRPGIAAMAAEVVGVLPQPPTVDELISLSVAHELFHHLEETTLGFVHQQLPPVTTLRLGRLWAKQTPVRACREIAAHRFAQVLTGWPYMPSLLDWLLLAKKQGWAPLAEVVQQAQTDLSFNNQP